MFQRYIAISLVLLATTTQPAICAGPPINVNVRSSALRRSIGKSGPSDKQSDPDATGAKSTAEQELTAASKKKGGGSQWGGVALDLAGAFDCHVSAPNFVSPSGRPANDGRKPLFRLGSNGAPSFFLGGRYDFSKVWYGANALFASLSWDGRRARERVCGVSGMPSEDEPSTQSSSMKRMRNTFDRCTLTVRAEKDLRGPGNFAAQAGLVKTMDSNDEPYPSVPPSLTLRVDSGTRSRQAAATVSIRTPIHRRVDIVSKSIVLLDLDCEGSTREEEDGQRFTSRVPSITTADDWSEGSWLPDVRLSPTGWLTARSEAGFLPFSLKGLRSIGMAAANSGMRAGVRLRVSRQVPWTLWGTPDEEEQETWVKLQLVGTSGDTYCSIALDAALERLVDSGRITLTQEQYLPPR